MTFKNRIPLIVTVSTLVFGVAAPMANVYGFHGARDEAPYWHDEGRRDEGPRHERRCDEERSSGSIGHPTSDSTVKA